MNVSYKHTRTQKEQHLLKKFFYNIQCYSKVWGQNIFSFFLKKLILLFSRDVKLIKKIIVKTYIVRKDFYFEQMLIFLTLYSSKNQRKKYHMFQKNNMKQHNSFNTHNNSAY